VLCSLSAPYVKKFLSADVYWLLKLFARTLMYLEIKVLYLIIFYSCFQVTITLIVVLELLLLLLLLLYKLPYFVFFVSFVVSSSLLVPTL
jgi:hypothetical protein